jgi:hypothetical protein
MNDVASKPTHAHFVEGRIYRRIKFAGRRATWAEGIYLDADYAEVKERTGVCVVFERTESGAVEDCFVVATQAVLDKERAVFVAQRCKLRPEPPPEIGPPL